ncbi:hypothetical protein KUCAC02_006623 [Chaenocephalus aceratus]|uniref:Uncharacterized protein n=1 Tax=Chaenocephalus aceratus TaxID=36190 RepID=A0ACB9VTI8_CHAAC|nr:hypothetical protein KUCAC02_006623 [Chaenocephalus aceratus]
MEYYTPQPNRRHNPVDSICRKLPFSGAIPKLSSNNYYSPQSGLRHNLESILKKGTLHRDEGGKGRGMSAAAASQRSNKGSSIPLPTSSTPANPKSPVTFHSHPRRCGPRARSPSKSPPLCRTITPNQGTLSYNLNFCSADHANSTEWELPYPALVVKRQSMGDGGSSVASETKENMAEISLICEENLLDTIFYACDTQRRGKVYVSHIVDFLRHTTSRNSGDSGLEDLCNMLDPEHKDISIDLVTYHAVMKEWIDDCRNNGEDTPDEVSQEDSVKLRDSLSAKRSMFFNITSGSLEAFGGEASRAEFETSELVCCVADLQMSNQKLEEEVRKMKLVVESMEDSNQKLAEENEELHNQATVNQQLAQKEKMLNEEVEEMKATLNCREEGRARASAHSKRVDRENQSLIASIASLQEENFRVTVETEELQRRIAELRNINTDLQVQIHSFDAVVGEKEAVIVEKSRLIDELKSTVEEYSSITELLRSHKSKLESQMQMMQPDMSGAGLSLSVAFRLNQSSSGSLQTELALAQSPLEAHYGVDLLSTTMSCVSPLDITLDREVLLMLQGPNPEQMAWEFKNLLNKLKRNFREETNSVLSTTRGLLDNCAQPAGDQDAVLQKVQAELDAKREDWALSLDQLAQYTDSLEKELMKMASNMRRSRTEILHLSVRVQEQENQKQQLCEELEQIKTPQDSRAASCQTPAPEEEPGDDLDWDEEFALQDFLKNELAERNCKEQGGRTERGEKEDAEERWTVVDTAGEGEVRDTSTPVSALSGRTLPRNGAAEESHDYAACTESEHDLDVQSMQEQEAVPLSAHSQAVGIRNPEADAPPDLSHSKNNNGEALVTEESPSCDPAQNQSSSPEQEPTVPPSNTPPTEVPTNSTTLGPDETITQTESTQPTSEDHREEEEKEGEADPSTGDMSRTKSPSQDQSADRSAAEDSTCLLPVLVEEEESVQDGTAEVVPTVSASMEETDRFTSSSPHSGSSVTHASQSGSGVGSVTSDPCQSEDSAAKKDSLPLGGKKKRELERESSMEVIEERKVQEDQSESSVATDKGSDMSGSSGTAIADKNSLSPNDKEIEADFQRLALGFKCDMFTLEKRLRLEERSRDLAEENVRKEISSCQGLLQALTPLCEDDNQSMEIIQRLQKNLEILIQSMSRVSSRSEMLGAIHQESRIGKAVEVMIQHVENLRRMYTKEHAELLELREALMQNERSFGSQTERGKDDFRGKKQPTQYYKSSTRRVSIAAIPRSGGGNMQFDMSKTQDCSETETERLTRRSPWTAYDNTDCQVEDEQKEEPVAERRRSSLSELGSKLTSLILPLKTPTPSPSPTSTDPGMAQSLSHSLTSSREAAAARSGRGLWLWLAMVVVLAGLLALLASLVMQPAVDAAPVGTGDSWMTIQQLLWPYTGLRHNGQPPV